MNNEYFSFLICDHRKAHGVINVYVNGLSLGNIRGDSFEVDPLFVQRLPKEDLIRVLKDVTAKLEIELSKR